MSAKLAVFNRQRRLPVDVSAFEVMYEQLRTKVFANLIKEPPEHMDEDVIEEIAKRGSFSVALVSNRQIQKLNKEWMEKNRPTDVLSFPLDLEPPPSPALPWDVGEIIISVERAQEQAEQFNHTFEREMAFLFVHGMLHVLGFDHMEPEDEKDMFRRQKQILNAAGIKR